MAELSAIVIDDEPLAIELMRDLLDRLGGVTVVAECRNGYEAIAAIGRYEPDLVFLDIQMPGLNGFEVVKSLQPETMPLIVFATAYDEFAVDAFDLHAVDYVLKPPTMERLSRSIERVRDRLRQQTSAGEDRKSPIIGAIEDMAERVDQAGASSPAAKLIIRDGGAAHLIDQEKIDWIDAAGDYMCLHVDGETHIARVTMKELVNQLDESIFARIHRSTIVNLERVTKITPLAKGECQLHLRQGAELKVSRSYSEKVKNRLN